MSNILLIRRANRHSTLFVSLAVYYILFHLYVANCKWSDVYGESENGAQAKQNDGHIVFSHTRKNISTEVQQWQKKLELQAKQTIMQMLHKLRKIRTAPDIDTAALQREARRIILPIKTTIRMLNAMAYRNEAHMNGCENFTSVDYKSRLVLELYLDRIQACFSTPTKYVALVRHVKEIPIKATNYTSTIRDCGTLDINCHQLVWQNVHQYFHSLSLDIRDCLQTFLRQFHDDFDAMRNCSRTVSSEALNATQLLKSNVVNCFSISLLPKIHSLGVSDDKLLKPSLQ